MPNPAAGQVNQRNYNSGLLQVGEQAKI